MSDDDVAAVVAVVKNAHSRPTAQEIHDAVPWGEFERTQAALDAAVEQKSLRSQMATGAEEDPAPTRYFVYT